MKNFRNSQLGSAFLQLLLGLALVLAAQPGRAQCDPPAAGIVGWWPGNGSTVDLVAGDNGTAEGTLTYGPGEVGQGFIFNGSSSYVLIPAAPVLNVGAGAGLTIETWINPADVSNERPLVEWNNGSTYGVHFWISVTGAGNGPGCIYANIVDTGGGGHTLSSAAGIVVTNQFQHVALTYNEATGIGTLYYNGVAVATQSLGVFTPQTTYNLYLGYRPGFAPSAIPMIEDAVSIYNRALTGTEILAIYTAGTAGKCPNELPPVIVRSPLPVTAAFGGNAGFTNVVAGSAPLSYQWLFNGTNLSGATNTILNLTNLTLAQIGSYVLSVSNSYGQAQSGVAFLAETGYDNCVAPLPGLADWWPGEGNGADAVGVKNGTLVGGVTITNGIAGQGFDFDGTSGYVDLGAWNPGLTWTMEAWVNPASLPSGRHAIAGDLANCNDWGLVLSSGQFGVVSKPPGGCTQTTTAATVITPGTWHHVAATCDGTNASIYVDGVLQASAPVQSGYVGDGTDVRIGSDVCCNEYFPGLVDEVSFYNRARSPVEIAAIYAAGSDGKCENFPRVASFSPTYSTTQVPTSAVITATFTKPIAAGTLTTNTFELFDLNHNPVPGTVAYNAANLTASFTPNPPLAAGSYYSATITTNITATNGSPLLGNIQWQFATAGNTVFFLDNNTTISSTVTSYDGQNLFIANAVVSVVSGTHPFGNITVAGSGTLFLNGATIKNATITTTNGGSFIVDGGGTLDGATVAGNLDVGNSYDGTVLSVTNGLVLNGTALVGNPTNYYRGIINFLGSQTLGGAGKLEFGPANGTYYNNEIQSWLPGTTLTIGSGITIRGQNGVVGSGAGAAISGPTNVGLINLGTIACDVSGGTISVNAQPVVNDGLLIMTNGGSLSLNYLPQVAGLSVSGSGTLTLGGSWQLNQSLSLTGTALSFNGNWTNAATINTSNSIVNLGGTFILADLGQFNPTGGVVNLTGTLTNTAHTLVLDGAGYGSWGLNGGTILGGTVITTNGASLIVKSGGGTLNGVTINGVLDVGNSYAQVSVGVTNGLVLNGTALVGNPTNQNWGAIGFLGTQTLSGNGTVIFGNQNAYYNALYPVYGGTTLTLGPAIEVHGQNGTIGYGSWWGGPQNTTNLNLGIIAADVAGGSISVNAQPFINNGLLNASAGTFNFGGTVNLSGGTINVGISSLSSFGQVNFAGEVALAGVLGVTLNNGFQPALGNTFTVLNYGSEGASFNSYNLPNGGLPWQVNYGVSSLTLSASQQLVPVVNLLSPINGAIVQAPTNILLAATATTQSGTIARMDFYQGTNLLVETTNSPYSVTWSNVPAGAYLITARATDTTGAVGVSSARSIIVLPSVSGTNYTWVAGSGNWSTAANWSPAGVPGAFDEATLLNGATVTLATNVTIGYLNFGSGTISGALLTVSNAFYWTGGVFYSPLTFATNSVVIINDGGNNDMPDTVVTNYGTVEWVSGTLRGGGSGGTLINNYGLWEAQSDQPFTADYGYNSVVFNNYGTFRKSGGQNTGQTVFRGGVAFNQLAGVVDVQNGDNGLNNGLNLVLQGNGNFTGGYITTNTAGVTVLSSGNFTINGTATPTNLIENAGYLVGTNVINGALTWQAGLWNGATSVTITTNSLLIVAGGGGNNDLPYTVVTNYGTVEWFSGTLRGGGNSGSIIDNYGLWNAQSDQVFNSAYGYNSVVFNNYGTFRKSGGTNNNATYFQSGVYFNQSAGVIDVQNGVNGLNFDLQGSGSFTGGYITTNTAGVTVLSIGNFTINGTVTPTNLIENSGNLVGANVINGGLTWQAGLWNGQSVTTVTITTNSTLIVAGGAGNNDMANSVVTNNGTVLWASGRIRGGGNNVNPGTAIYNNGLWVAQSDQVLNNDYGYNSTVFNNYGTFRKTGGTNNPGT